MVQVKDDGGLEHDGSRGGNENQMDLECILKVEPIRLADGIKERGRRDDLGVQFVQLGECSCHFLR